MPDQQGDMLKIYYNKLCRDKIPQIIHDKGFACEVRELGHAEYQREIVKKVFEEASGVANYGTREELLTELADLIITIDAVRKEFTITDEEFDAAVQKSIAHKGVYDKRFYLAWSSDVDYSSKDKQRSFDD